MRRFVVPAILAMSVFASAAMAGESAAIQKLNQAKELFDQRLDLAKNNEAIKVLESALSEAESNDTKYDILILAARAYYWNGTKAKGDSAKMAEYDKAMAKSAEAKKLFDEYSEAYYYYAISLGKWALAKGVQHSLFRKDELIANANGAIERTTRDGEPGITIDGYGPNRTLGYLEYKLRYLGHSLRKGTDLLRVAFDNAPELALNTVYYAELLAEGTSSQKKLARRYLDELLAKDPYKLNPARTPETLEEFELGRQLRKELGN